MVAPRRGVGKLRGVVEIKEIFSLPDIVEGI